MTYIRNHKRFAGVLAFFAIAATSALAAWVVNGHGRGQGKVGTLQTPSVSEGVANADLLPGGDGSAAFVINNPNPMPLTVRDADPGPDGITSSDPAACPTSNLTVNNLRSLSVAVPKGSSTVIVPGALHLAADAPSSCQGVTFSVDTALGFVAGGGA